MSKTVAIHQPDYLPYSGFWYKMYHSDVFIIALHDQFQKSGYQRRVKMRDAWVSHQLVGSPALLPIKEVIVKEGWQERTANAIQGRYVKSAHWKDRGKDLVEQIRSLETPSDSLVNVNMALIEVIRDQLGIKTELVVTEPPTQSGTERLIEQTLMVDGDQYLSGTGGLAYMGENPEKRFQERGVELVWSKHQHSTGDSIISVLLDYDDPMEIVLKETEA